MCKSGERVDRRLMMKLREGTAICLSIYAIHCHILLSSSPDTCIYLLTDNWYWWIIGSVCYVHHHLHV